MIYTLTIGIFRRVSTLAPGLNFGLKTQSNVTRRTQSTLSTLILVMTEPLIVCEFCVCNFGMADNHIYHCVGLDGYWGQNDWIPMGPSPCVARANEEQPPARTPEVDIT